MNHLPNKLLKLRKHYHYSQSFVAQVLDLEPIEYMAYENGRAVLNFEQVKKLAHFYHITPMELFRNSEEVTLYDVNKADTDEINIAFFLPPKSTKEKLMDFFNQYKWMIVGGLSVLILLLILLLPQENTSDLSLGFVNTDRLDASETTVVYVDRHGSVKGRGDNSNGQLNLDFDDVIKVKEGSTFTVVLHSDGSLDSVGLLTKYANDIKDWKNIVDVDCGSGHIVAINQEGTLLCTGDKTYGQCDLNGEKGIEKIFATALGTIAVKEDGQILASGNFIGSSQLKHHSSLIDVASSNEVLVLLDESQSLTYYSRNKEFKNAPLWDNLVQVACGDDFIAALDEDGNVYIDIENYLIVEEVDKWMDMIAIAAGSDYLVAYDEHQIYGVGKNTYKQFESTEIVKHRLAQVKNIKTSVDENYVTIQFDPVENASSYLVEIDIGTGISIMVEENLMTLDTTRFTDGYTYRIKITTIGSGDYENSSPYIFEFVYKQIENEVDEPNEDKEEEPSIDIVEIPFALDQLVGKTKNNFDAYLKGLGVNFNQVEAIESENPCEGSEAMIESVEGIGDYEMITHSELLKRQIKYTYCEVQKDES